MKIEWEKIVTNAVSALVVGAFMGAAAIVWRGATTVDDKVRTTETKLEFVIKQLSDKLATYEVRMNEITNQLTKVLEQTKPVETPPIIPRLFGGDAHQQRLIEQQVQQQDQQRVQQRALSKDIYEQLNRK